MYLNDYDIKEFFGHKHNISDLIYLKSAFLCAHRGPEDRQPGPPCTAEERGGGGGWEAADSGLLQPAAPAHQLSAHRECRPGSRVMRSLKPHSNHFLWMICRDSRMNLINVTNSPSTFPILLHTGIVMTISLCCHKRDPRDRTMSSVLWSCKLASENGIPNYPRVPLPFCLTETDFSHI